MSSAPKGFFAKLDAAVAGRNSLLCVGLDPQPGRLPARFQPTKQSLHTETTESDGAEAAEPLLAWNLAVIEATSTYACAYKPNIAFYEALGKPGMELLRATLDAIPNDIPVLLDAKRSDMGNTAAAYARACFDIWQVDAVTLNPYLGQDSIAPFLKYPDKGLFLLCHTSNPGSADFQELEINDWRTLDREPHQPLYIHVARQATQWSENIGLVVGATYPAAISAARSAAPLAWFLIPGIGAQGGDLEASVHAGLREDNSGVLVNASRSIAGADNPGQAARELRDAINVARRSAERRATQTAVLQRTDHGPPPTTSTPASEGFTPLSITAQRLIHGLVDLDAIQFGAFTLASGLQSPFYIDLRLLVSRPDLLALAAEAYAQVLGQIQCDRFAGVPYAALPIGTAVSLHTNIPLIYPRKEAKAHGTGKEFEGAWQPGERVAIIEDVITSGGSTLQTCERLRAAGLVVEDAVVLIDREQGGVAKLAAAGLRAHSVFKLSTILHFLETNARITPEQAGAARRFVAESQV